MHKSRFILSSLLAVAPLAAFAADLGVANQFNAFVFGNASLQGGHADGAVAIGGNLSGSDYTFLMGNYPATIGSDNKIGLYVGGSVNMSNKVTVNNSGNARIGGTASAQNGFQMNGGTRYTGAGANIDPTVFTSQQTYSLTQSDYLFSLTATSINTANQNNWSVNAASVATQYGTAKLVSIPATSLNNLRTLDIQGLGANETLIINVLGNADVTNFGITLNGAYNRVLWNYGGAGNFRVTDRALHGSLLAPRASVYSSQNIDGTLIANSWTNVNSVEIHRGNGITFDGFVPSADPVPEPASMVALGLGAAAFIRRRRAK